MIIEKKYSDNENEPEQQKIRTKKKKGISNYIRN